MAKSSTILVLNGPNLNMLGTREPDVYGRESLGDIEAACGAKAEQLGYAIDFRQSNSESEIVSWIQDARGVNDGIILNAGAYTHTSIAILDALKACGVPIIEVHLSNIFQREEFRHHSYVSPAADGLICGFGGTSYVLAVDALAALLQNKKKSSQSPTRGG